MSHSSTLFFFFWETSKNPTSKLFTNHATCNEHSWIFCYMLKTSNNIYFSVVWGSCGCCHYLTLVLRKLAYIDLHSTWSQIFSSWHKILLLAGIFLLIDLNLSWSDIEPSMWGNKTHDELLTWRKLKNINYIDKNNKEKNT